MNNIINSVVPLMTALVQKPGLDSSTERLEAAGKQIMSLMSETSQKVLKVFAQDDPQYLSLINRTLSLLVAKTWQVSDINPDTSEKIAQIFISIIDSIDIDPDQAFDQDNMTIGIDTANWVSKCLPTIIELRQIDPEKSGRGKLLLGNKSYEEHIAFIQRKITERIEPVAKKTRIKDPKGIGQAISDLFAVIIQTQFDVLTKKVKAMHTTEEQKAFLEEKTKYPEGILIETSLDHLDAILKICFPGAKKD